ncbi:ADP-ribosyltransferase [Bacillus mycoides]|uniref:ADP-ribosyltransferase n=1 Tax=Bacillus mycoides TaxID=1405 RepID=UPI00382B250F
MLFKKKIACASLLSLGILAGSSFVGNSTVLAGGGSSKIQNSQEQFQDVKNFNRDLINGQKWLEDHLRPFYNSLSDYQKNLLDYYTYDGYPINDYLRNSRSFIDDKELPFNFYFHRGDIRNGEWLTALEKSEGYKNARYYRDFDQLFKKEGAKLPNTMVLYRKASEDEFMKGLNVISIYKEDMINKSVFNKFKKAFKHKTIQNMGYTSTSICKDYSYQYTDRPILIELSVPKGVPAIYIPNGYAEVVLPRNISYQIDEISLFNEEQYNEFRKESVKVKAHLVIN